MYPDLFPYMSRNYKTVGCNTSNGIVIIIIIIITVIVISIIIVKASF